ncbi:hypothetical protein IE81DRAFT_243443 [Ceraceosorus guamensis]|uniref:Uncharacterized protein n=1 Tax=Ceraceosorus guamensis TaxID=1522189 RepID=A0A316W543_9BASI|nr:hypothetical protein IE81DRAFT_243443 [Ceraceosorus guamensis]PWN44919.1 hypothetical protein IE81DRAFT_243443 [Ceraceosorus guamensis]
MHEMSKRLRVRPRPPLPARPLLYALSPSATDVLDLQRELHNAIFGASRSVSVVDGRAASPIVHATTIPQNLRLSIDGFEVFGNPQQVLRDGDTIDVFAVDGVADESPFFAGQNGTPAPLAPPSAPLAVPFFEDSAARSSAKRHREYDAQQRSSAAAVYSAADDQATSSGSKRVKETSGPEEDAQNVTALTKTQRRALQRKSQRQAIKDSHLQQQADASADLSGTLTGSEQHSKAEEELLESAERVADRIRARFGNDRSEAPDELERQEASEEGDAMSIDDLPRMEPAVTRSTKPTSDRKSTAAMPLPPLGLGSVGLARSIGTTGAAMLAFDARKAGRIAQMQPPKAAVGAALPLEAALPVQAESSGSDSSASSSTNSTSTSTSSSSATTPVPRKDSSKPKPSVKPNAGPWVKPGEGKAKTQAKNAKRRAKQREELLKTRREEFEALQTRRALGLPRPPENEGQAGPSRPKHATSSVIQPTISELTSDETESDSSSDSDSDETSSSSNNSESASGEDPDSSSDVSEIESDASTSSSDTSSNLKTPGWNLSTTSSVLAQLPSKQAPQASAPLELPPGGGLLGLEDDIEMEDLDDNSVAGPSVLPQSSLEEVARRMLRRRANTRRGPLASHAITNSISARFRAAVDAGESADVAPADASELPSSSHSVTPSVSTAVASTTSSETPRRAPPLPSAQPLPPGVRVKSLDCSQWYDMAWSSGWPDGWYPTSSDEPLPETTEAATVPDDDVDVVADDSAIDEEVRAQEEWARLQAQARAATDVALQQEKDAETQKPPRFPQTDQAPATTTIHNAEVLASGLPSALDAVSPQQASAIALDISDATNAATLHRLSAPTTSVPAVKVTLSPPGAHSSLPLASPSHLSPSSMHMPSKVALRIEPMAAPAPLFGASGQHRQTQTSPRATPEPGSAVSPRDGRRSVDKSRASKDRSPREHRSWEEERERYRHSSTDYRHDREDRTRSERYRSDYGSREATLNERDSSRHSKSVYEDRPRSVDHSAKNGARPRDDYDVKYASRSWEHDRYRPARSPRESSTYRPRNEDRQDDVRYSRYYDRKKSEDNEKGRSAGEASRVSSDKSGRESSSRLSETKVAPASPPKSPRLHRAALREARIPSNVSTSHDLRPSALPHAPKIISEGQSANSAHQKIPTGPRGTATTARASAAPARKYKDIDHAKGEVSSKDPSRSFAYMNLDYGSPEPGEIAEQRAKDLTPVQNEVPPKSSVPERPNGSTEQEANIAPEQTQPTAKQPSPISPNTSAASLPPDVLRLREMALASRKKR